MAAFGAAKGGSTFTFIEVMPMGEIVGRSSPPSEQYLPLSMVRAELKKRWTLLDIDDTTGGPARYVRVGETGGRIGFITPMTHGFCEDRNRVRLTCTGTLFMCLGQEDAADLRKPLRTGDDKTLKWMLSTLLLRGSRKAMTSSLTDAELHRPL